MKHVERSALVAYTNQQMYDLVADVPRYEEFLPWCSESTQRTESDDVVIATVGISLGALHKSFSTRNTNFPHRRIQLELVDGPFRSLEGEWLFNPRGETGSEVVLKLQYEFSNALFSAAVAPIFDRISDSMVDAFVDRASVIY